MNEELLRAQGFQRAASVKEITLQSSPDYHDMERRYKRLEEELQMKEKDYLDQIEKLRALLKPIDSSVNSSQININRVLELEMENTRLKEKLACVEFRFYNEFQKSNAKLSPEQKMKLPRNIERMGKILGQRKKYAPQELTPQAIPQEIPVRADMSKFDFYSQESVFAPPVANQNAAASNIIRIEHSVTEVNNSQQSNSQKFRKEKPQYIYYDQNGRLLTTDAEPQQNRHAAAFIERWVATCTESLKSKYGANAFNALGQ